jgi:hypothetical protein
MRKLLLVTIILIILAGCSSDQSDGPPQVAQQTAPTDTLEPTATPLPTHTPTPTATAVPTNTPTPSATPTPTHTPEPTATPTPDYTEAVGVFQSELEEVKNDTAVYVGATASFFEDAGDDVALFLDREWLDSVAITSKLASETFFGFGLLEAPPPLADLHADLSDAADVCGRALADMYDAAIGRESELVVRAFRDLVDCTEDFRNSNEAIAQAIEEWGTVSDAPAEPEPSETPEPTPTVAATEQSEPAQATVVASSAIEYENYEGVYRVFGLVGNSGSTDISFVKVNVDLLDSQGTVLASESVYAHIYPLAPGEASTFEAVFPEIPADMAGYDISVEFSNPAFKTYPDIEIVSATGAIAGRGGYEITGTVANNGDSDVTFTKLCAAFFDKDGDLIGVAWGFADQEEIPAGSSSTFSIGVKYSYLEGENVDSYLLFVKARDYG